MRAFLLSVFFVLAQPGASLADWEFTKWGMTEPQVLAAGRGKQLNPTAGNETVAPYTDMNASCTLKMSGYEFAGFVFDRIEFCFSKNTAKLVGVYLVLNDSNKFSALDKAMSGSMGPPVQDTRGGQSRIQSRLFNDLKKGNSVLLMNMDVSVTLTYRPLPKGF
jgi:hypothetical protein